MSGVMKPIVKKSAKCSVSQCKYEERQNQSSPLPQVKADKVFLQRLFLNQFLHSFIFLFCVFNYILN